MISLTVPGEPVAKERPRTVNGHTYTPQKTLDHEQKIRDVWNLTRATKDWDVAGRFSVELSFFLERDNKDLDNLIKTCLDALNKLAWKDDRQVVQIAAFKAKEKPGATFITIRRIEE